MYGKFHCLRLRLLQMCRSDGSLHLILGRFFRGYIGVI